MFTLRRFLPGWRWQRNRALLAAVRRGDTEEARRLLELGADVNGREGSHSALAIAGRSPWSDAATVRLLLEWGASVNPGPHSPLMSPLLVSAHLSDSERIRLLVEYGADLNVIDRRGTGHTVLQELVTWANGETVNWVIGRGADVDLRDPVKEGTALHAAAAVPNPASIIVLMARGADVNARDKEGRTPLSYAETMRARQPSGYAQIAGAYAEAIRLLTQAGAV